MTYAETCRVAHALVWAGLGEPDPVLNVLVRLQDYLPQYSWFEVLCQVYPEAECWREEWVRCYLPLVSH